MGGQQTTGPIMPGPGYWNPYTSPETRLQQALNPPGPSRPTWMAPIMENQQAIATSLDPSTSPQQRTALNQSLGQDALKTVMSFGGADITKEQRAAWEAENDRYRAQQFGKDVPGEAIPPGTRVQARGGRQYTEQWGGKERASEQGVVVRPGTPEAGKPGSVFAQRGLDAPGPEFVPVRNEGSPVWHWRHRDDLEILAPEHEFPVGTEVQFAGAHRGQVFDGTVGEPPKSRPNPGRPKSDFVWVDVDVGPDEPPRGGWFHKKDLGKKDK